MLKNNKKTLISIVVIAVTLISIPRVIFAQPDKKTINEIERRLNTTLLQGWSMTSEENVFILSKEKEIQLYNSMSMEILENEPSKDRYTRKIKCKIKLVVESFMDYSSYIKIKNINDKIPAGKDSPIKKSEFYINNGGAWREYDTRYQELPDYYGDNFSIYCYTNLHPYEWILPEESALEFTNVIKMFENIFTKYK